MSLKTLAKKIVACRACPRLIQHCEAIAATKRRQYKDETYWGKPVPGFGDSEAQLWIVGLAPGAHGANRTGRMFTGDSSGDWLYRALYETGFASAPKSTSKDDGLTLTRAFISAAGRCAPPDNKPTRDELERCFPFLKMEYEGLKKLKVILALGKIGFDSVKRLLKEEWASSKVADFKHGQVQKLGELYIVSSYHPSRQNTQTGRLTWAMWISVFQKTKELCRS